MDPRAFLTGSSISTSNGLQMMTNFCHAANANNPAATRVSAGLQMLSNISTAMGKGGKLPVSIDSVGNNTKWILSTLGINTQTLYAAGQATLQPDGTYSSPTVVDAGLTAAQQLFDRVKSGTFTINDIPLFHTPLNALYQYQQSVINSRISSSTYSSGFTTTDPVANHPLPWANDIDTALPKYKFMFAVQIKFTAPYLGGSGNGTLTRQLSLVAKRSTRPSVNYDLQDANYYNFRTKYVAKADFEDMSISFYDDSRNSAHALMTGYVSAMSPVTNSPTDGLFEQQGMLGAVASQTLNNTTGAGASTASFSQPYVKNNSGSTGALNGVDTVIKEIKLYQIFDNGRRVNVYTFINPRVRSFTLDEVDMASSEISTIDMKFAYESVQTQLSLSMADVATQLTDLTSAGKYAIGYNGTPGNKVGNTQYNATAVANATRNSCLADATNMISSTIGAVENYLGKLF